MRWKEEALWKLRDAEEVSRVPEEILADQESGGQDLELDVEQTELGGVSRVSSVGSSAKWG